MILSRVPYLYQTWRNQPVSIKFRYSVDHNLVSLNMNLLITAGFTGDIELAKNTCILLQQGVPAKKQVNHWSPDPHLIILSGILDVRYLANYECSVMNVVTFIKKW